MAFSIIIYQHLDNIDGKQARKTSTYSTNSRVIKSIRHAIRSRLWCHQCLSSCHSGHENTSIVLWNAVFMHILDDNEHILFRHVEPILSGLFQTGENKPSWWRIAYLCNNVLTCNSMRFESICKYLAHIRDIFWVVNILPAGAIGPSEHLHDKRHPEQEDNLGGVNNVHALAIYLSRDHNPTDILVNFGYDSPSILLHFLLDHVHVVTQYDKHSAAVHHKAEISGVQQGNPFFHCAVCSVYRTEQSYQCGHLYLFSCCLHYTGDRFSGVCVEGALGRNRNTWHSSILTPASY